MNRIDRIGEASCRSCSITTRSRREGGSRPAPPGGAQRVPRPVDLTAGEAAGGPHRYGTTCENEGGCHMPGERTSLLGRRDRVKSRRGRVVWSSVLLSLMLALVA